MVRLVFSSAAVPKQKTEDTARGWKRVVPELVPGPLVAMPSTRVWVKQGLDSHRSAQVLLVPLGNIPPDVYSRYCEILRRFRCALCPLCAAFAAVAALCFFQER